MQNGESSARGQSVVNRVVMALNYRGGGRSHLIRLAICPWWSDDGANNGDPVVSEAFRVGKLVFFSEANGWGALRDNVRLWDLCSVIRVIYARSYKGDFKNNATAVTKWKK